MPSYNFENGTLARRNAAAKVARHNAVKAVSALPAPVRAQKLADVVSTLSDVDLVAVLAGGVNLQAVLRKSLADRGMDERGQWVGFAAADHLFDVWFTQTAQLGAHQGTGL